MRQPLMIDKPVIKLYKSLHHCYHWTVLDIFTNCRSSRCEKKQKRFENFFSLSLCYLSDAKNELSSQQSAQQSCTPYVQKNIYQISRKITKRSKNDSTNRILKREKKKETFLKHLFTSPLLFSLILYEY